eukprot:gene11935-15976_t
MGSKMQSSSTDHSIATIVAEEPIVVFSSSTCPYCREAINALKSAGYEPLIVEADSQQRQELRSITSVSSVPSIWIKGTYVGGCNDGPESWMGIKKLLRNEKKLQELLSS